jgi:hypothetical protein
MRSRQTFRILYEDCPVPRKKEKFNHKGTKDTKDFTKSAPDVILRAIFVSFVPLWLNFFPRLGQVLTLGGRRRSKSDRPAKLQQRTKRLLCLGARGKIPAMASIVEAAENKSLLLLFFRKEDLPFWPAFPAASAILQPPRQS